MGGKLEQQQPFQIGEGIVEALCRPDTILLIGAGISRWSGIPGLEALLYELASFCEKIGKNTTDAKRQIDEKDFSLAASLLKHMISEEEYCRFFRELSAFNQAGPNKVHRKLLEFPQRSFLTTNYDHLIEKTWDSLGGRSPLRKICHNNLADLSSINSTGAVDFVYKCHGDIDNPKDIIFTIEDYNDWQQKNPAAQKAIENLLLNRHIVTFGYRYKDPNLNWIYDNLRSIYGSHTKRVHVVTSEVSQSTTAEYYRNKRGLEITRYHAVGDDHGNLLVLLDELIKQVKLRTIRKEPPQHTDQQHMTEADSFLKSLQIIDTDIRHIVMSLVYWNGGLRLDQLVNLLTQHQFREFQIISSINTLVGANGLVRVNDLLLPDPTGHCKAIAFSRVEDVELLIGETIHGN